MRVVPNRIVRRGEAVARRVGCKHLIDEIEHACRASARYRRTQVRELETGGFDFCLEHAEVVSEGLRRGALKAEDRLLLVTHGEQRARPRALACADTREEFFSELD